MEYLYADYNQHKHMGYLFLIYTIIYTTFQEN